MKQDATYSSDPDVYFATSRYHEMLVLLSEHSFILACLQSGANLNLVRYSWGRAKMAVHRVIFYICGHYKCSLSITPLCPHPDILESQPFTSRRGVHPCGTISVLQQSPPPCFTVIQWKPQGGRSPGSFIFLTFELKAIRKACCCGWFTIGAITSP